VASRDVIVAGHICLDIIPAIPQIVTSGENLFVPGRLMPVGEAVVATGGAVANTGMALYKLGVSVKLMGKIGDDMFGKTILEILNQSHDSLTEGMIVANGEQSSYTIVINPPHSDRMFLHCSGANDTFSSNDVQLERFAQGTLFHFGYPPLMRSMYENEGDGLATLLRKVKEQGLVTSLDMAKPDPDSEAGKADWHAILQKTLPFTDLFLPSLEELLFMLRREDYESFVSNSGDHFLKSEGGDLLTSLSGELLRMGCAIVAIKLGEYGLYLRTTADEERLKLLGQGDLKPLEAWCGRELYVPCYEVEVQGTTGAGDCTIAGLLAGFVKGLTPEEALQSAVGVGACCVEKLDATSGIVGWNEIRQRIDKGWSAMDVLLPLPSWYKRDQGSIWFGPKDRHS
jgi:sugar/nucleoside kinase (ribokinase family)